MPFLFSLSAALPTTGTTSSSNIIVTAVIIILINTIFYGGLIYLFVLLVKALRKYLRSCNIQKENAAVFQSLGEALKTHRLRCGMTQEFVAEQLGVSRQAVSKWENGSSDPSTGNLLALAKLYGINAADLLRESQ